MFKFVTIQLDVTDKPVTLIIDTASSISIIKLSCLKADVEIASQMRTTINGINTGKTIKTLGMILGSFKNGRKTNYFQFEVVDDKHLQLGEEYDGIIGLNILKKSEISLLKNYVNLHENDLLVPLNLENKAKFKHKRAASHLEPKNSSKPHEQKLCLLVQSSQTEKIVDPNKRFEILKNLVKIKTNDEHILAQVHKILYKYSNTFFIEGDSLEATHRKVHTIKLKDDAKPSFIRQFPIKESLMEELKRQVNELEEQGIVRKCSKSLWNSPIFLVKKKENEFRLVVDLRALNEKIVTSFQELPSIEGILFNLRNKSVFSVIDLKNAYYTIALDEQSQHLTAFTVGHKRYMFQRNVMGLKEGGFVFIEMITELLEDLINEILFIFVDDVCIFSTDEETAVRNLEITIDRLNSAGIKISPKKSTLLAKEIEFLGHVVNSNGVLVHPEKIRIISNFPRPECIKQVRGFLGMSSYYRRYLPDFSELSTPLIELTKKRTKFAWSEECEKSFLKLKEKLSNAITLSFIDPNKTFLVTTDASAHSVAGVLSQIGDNNEEIPISFCSRKLNKVESATSSFERELIAVCYAVCVAFKTFLYTKQFIIKVDNRALVYVLNNKLEHNTDRIIRLRLKLMPFDFKVMFQKGNTAAHITADLISRTKFASEKEIIKSDDDSAKIFAITRAQKEKLRDEITEEFNKFSRCVDTSKTPTNVKISTHELNTADTKRHKMILTSTLQPIFPENLNDFMTKILKKEKLTVGEAIEYENFTIIPFKQSFHEKIEPSELFILLSKARDKLISKKVNHLDITFTVDHLLPESTVLHLIAFVFRNNPFAITLYKNETSEIIDQKEKISIIESFHKTLSGLHRGVKTTIEKIKKRFRWQSMKADIENYIRNCHECQINKRGANKKKIPLKLVSSSDETFEKIYFDAIGGFNTSDNGCRYCITMLDDLSKFLICCPVPDLTTETVATTIIHELFLRYSVPKYLVADNQISFNSDLFKRFCKAFNIRKINCTPYHPESNGALERTHFSIKTMIKSFINKDLNDWHLLLDYAVSTYNKSYHSSIGTSPHEIIYGKAARPVEMISKQSVTDYTVEDYMYRLKLNMQRAVEQAKLNSDQSKRKRKEIYDTSTKEFEINVGDKILIKTNYIANRKFKPSFSGPYVVISSHDQYVEYLNSNGKVKKIHKNNIKKYHEATA